MYQKGMDVKYTIEYTMGWPGLSKTKNVRKKFVDENEAWAFYRKLQDNEDPATEIKEATIIKNEKLDWFVNEQPPVV